MPTNQNAYNSRVTDESLEKKFRDTFKSQGGAELVDDLYASGVIVPVVDFTAAAEGSALRSDLQTAYDFATGFAESNGAGTVSVINSPGFWKTSVTVRLRDDNVANDSVDMRISDGATTKFVFRLVGAATPVGNVENFINFERVVFLRSGDTLTIAAGTDFFISVSYRQIADVYGNLTNPLGYTSS